MLLPTGLRHAQPATARCAHLRRSRIRRELHRRRRELVLQATTQVVQAFETQPTGALWDRRLDQPQAVLARTEL